MDGDLPNQLCGGETAKMVNRYFCPTLNRQRYDDYKVQVIFTEEDETADDYIERTAAELNTSLNLVEVATSDLNEQWTVFAQGCLRVSAYELE